MSRIAIIRHGLLEKDGRTLAKRGKIATRLLAWKLQRLGIRDPQFLVSTDPLASATMHELMQAYKASDDMLRVERLLDCPTQETEVPFMSIRDLLISEQKASDIVVVLGDCLVLHQLVECFCMHMLFSSPKSEVLCGCALVIDYDMQSCVMVGSPTHSRKKVIRKGESPHV